MRRLIAVCAVVACAGPVAAGPAAAAPTWAPAASATVHPGVQTVTDGGQCTSNFVFYDASNNVYIGQAAHCAGTDGNTATPGIPGDSGSAFIDARGRAFGILSTLQIAPLAGGNGVGDVSRELAYMR